MTHEEFRIRYYEVGPDGAVPLHTLCDYFQEAAGIDAHTLKFGAEDLADSGVTWVLTRLQVTPLIKAIGGSTLTVHTWHSFSDKLFSRREFYITNEKNETVLKGASWWILMDIKTRRLTRTSQVLLDRNPAQPNYVLAENNPKALDFAGVEPVAKLAIIVRDEDIDTNAHVNNTHFTAWAIESTPKDASEVRTLKELVISFKNECFSKDKLSIAVYEIPSEAGRAFWHILTRENDGKETARIFTHWE